MGSVQYVGASYSDFYLDDVDAAVCVRCGETVQFNPGNIDALILAINDHECRPDD